MCAGRHRCLHITIDLIISGGGRSEPIKRGVEARIGVKLFGVDVDFGGHIGCDRLRQIGIGAERRGAIRNDHRLPNPRPLHNAVRDNDRAVIVGSNRRIVPIKRALTAIVGDVNPLQIHGHARLPDHGTHDGGVQRTDHIGVQLTGGDYAYAVC